MFFLKILCAIDPKQLRLSPHDDKIYSRFRELFGDFKIDTLDEDKIKSNEAKIVIQNEFIYNINQRIDLVLCLVLEIIL